MCPSQPHRDYSGTPLERKLGLVTAKGAIGEVALLAEPAGFRELLGEIDGVTFYPRLRSGTALGICFVRTRREMEAVVELLSSQLPPAAHAWIVHPKAHRKPDLNQNDVRDAALAAGFVDYKVCSVDQDWSGLKFARRTKAAQAGQ